MNFSYFRKIKLTNCLSTSIRLLTVSIAMIFGAYFFYCYFHNIVLTGIVGYRFDFELAFISSGYILLIALFFFCLSIKKINRAPDWLFLLIVCAIDLCICYFLIKYLQANFPSKIDPGLYHKEASRACQYTEWKQFSARYNNIWFRRALFSFFIPYKLLGISTTVFKLANTFMHLCLACNIYFICKNIFKSKTAAQCGILLYFLIPTSYFSINSLPHDLWGASYLSFTLLALVKLFDGRIFNFVTDIKKHTSAKLLLLPCIKILVLYGVFFVSIFMMSLARDPILAKLVFLIVFVYSIGAWWKQCKAYSVSKKLASWLLLGVLVITVMLPNIVIETCSPPFDTITFWEHVTRVSSPCRDIGGEHFPSSLAKSSPGDSFLRTLNFSTLAHEPSFYYNNVTSRSSGLFSLNDIGKTVTDSQHEVIKSVYNLQKKLMPIVSCFLWTLVACGIFVCAFLHRIINYRMGALLAFSAFLFGAAFFGEGQPNYLQTVYPLIIILATEGVLFILKGNHFCSPSTDDGNSTAKKKSFAIPLFFFMLFLAQIIMAYAPSCMKFLLKSSKCDFICISNPTSVVCPQPYSKDMLSFIDKSKNYFWNYFPLPSKKGDALIVEWDIPKYPVSTIKGFLEITEKSMSSYEISLRCDGSELVPPREEWIREIDIRPPRRKPMQSIYVDRTTETSKGKMHLIVKCKEDLPAVSSSFERMITVYTMQVRCSK